MRIPDTGAVELIYAFPISGSKMGNCMDENRRKTIGILGQTLETMDPVAMFDGVNDSPLDAR